MVPHRFALFKICVIISGAWEDNQTADEKIKDIYSSNN